jgi:hypothetical protein
VGLGITSGCTPIIVAGRRMIGPTVALLLLLPSLGQHGISTDPKQNNVHHVHQVESIIDAGVANGVGSFSHEEARSMLLQQQELWLLSCSAIEEEEDSCITQLYSCINAQQQHSGPDCTPDQVADEEPCALGWQGEDCDQCAPGHSGEDCAWDTPPQLAQQEEEDSCIDGWGGELCDQCSPGHNGPDCTPDQVADEEPCALGWQGEDCDQCAPGHSGEDCAWETPPQVKQLCELGLHDHDRDVQTPCELCPTSTYRDMTSGSEDCIPCPDGLVSTPGSPSSADCVSSHPHTADRTVAANAKATSVIPARDAGCLPGWQGGDCDKCAPGHSGEDCTPISAAAPKKPAEGTVAKFPNSSPVTRGPPPPWDESGYIITHYCQGRCGTHTRAHTILLAGRPRACIQEAPQLTRTGLSTGVHGVMYPPALKIL